MCILREPSRTALLQRTAGVLLVFMFAAWSGLLADAEKRPEPFSLGGAVYAVVSPVRVIAGRIVSDYLLADLDDTGRSAGALSVRLDEISRLLCDPAVLSPEWLERIHTSGVIDGALFMTGSRTRAVGREFVPRFSETMGFFIDASGRLHYRCSVREGTFLDTEVSLQYLAEAIEDGYPPAAAALVDSESGNTAFIRGDETMLSTDSIIARGSRFIDPAHAVLVRTLYTGKSDILLVTLYRYIPGRRSGHVIGLLALVIIALFVVTGTLFSISRARKEVMRAVKVGAVMAEEKESKSIISEIDREISDIIEEHVPVRKKRPGPDSRTGGLQDAGAKDMEKKYEDDGITIRRGA